MGIPTEKDEQNLSLALGSMTYGVTPEQLAAAYVPYANGGMYYKPHSILKIIDADGNIIYENDSEGVQVTSAQNAYLMTSMLQSVVSNGTGTRLQSANMQLAGKTGTVSMKNGNRDIWMVAYNPTIVVSVWMGFDKTDAVHKIANGITGGKNTASLAAAFFKAAYADKEKPTFNAPDGLVWLTIDHQALITKGSVMLASSTTPESAKISEVFTTSNRPYAVSDVWNAPSAPASFYVAHDSAGYPLLSFKASSNARYRIQRDTVGESIVLTEIVGSSGQTLTYSDYSAVPGVLYTYRIIPLHEELLKQGIWLEGKQAVQTAQVSTSSNNLWGSLSSFIPALSIIRQ
jgi:membrane peptidoglycan carboxypeptidase